MRCRQGVGIRLRRAEFVVLSLTLLLVLIATTASAEQCPPPLAFPCFTAKPLIDGDATPLYKGLHGLLYGDYSHTGYALSTQEPGPNPTLHDTDGMNRAAGIVPICHDGSQNNCDQSEKKIVVVALGFSNWTKEVCGDQWSQPSGVSDGNYQADHSGEWPEIPPANPIGYLACGPNTWSFVYYSGVNDVGHPIEFVDCAIIGAVAKWWKNDNRPGIDAPPPHGLYTNCSNILYAAGSDPRQVQVVLFKDADSNKQEADGYQIERIAHQRLHWM